MNRELGASFDLRSFQHLAIWNDRESTIEMHLCSLVEQAVRIAGADCVASFREGETIWTESSRKYTAQSLHDMSASAGFRVDGDWTDAEWPFVESLWLAE
jgi:uncharacterized SAM-dependent methyltransferase